MGFVEGDDPFEVRAGPVEDLLETAMVAADGPQCRIGDEKDALFEGDGFVDRPVRQGLDVGCKAPERGPVAPRVFEQRLVLRDPHVATASRSDEHTSELQSLMRISYAVFCLKKKTKTQNINSCNYRYVRHH